MAAQKYIYLSNISLLPKLKKDADRKKWFTGLKRTIYGNLVSRDTPIGYDELKAKLAGTLSNG